MLIELSSSPKPGNVDRCHDFIDLTFQQFLVSAVSAYPTFRKAAAGEGRIGRLLLDAVGSWRFWNIPGNTHFGSLVLMIPLCVAAGRCAENMDRLEEELTEVLKETNVDDAMDFYAAFDLAKARVSNVPMFSLRDPAWHEKLQRQGKILLDLMNLSRGHDLIACEWSSGYKRSFQTADRLAEKVESCGLVEGVVRTYLEALSEEPDSLVQSKFGAELAKEVSLRAKLALKDETLESARKLDRELLDEDVNPGSTADLIAASLLISLLRGLRF
ncbi:2-(5''-triphosphoribosyl)-3'-dephosphocoenzyme-A synthase [uncultured archaeon]|nr:2-(5''-triphosphoribosyl)-3'-dephosphocoenzyme-A synthase [uncultured archaeon]